MATGDAAAKLPVPEQVALKEPADFKVDRDTTPASRHRRQSRRRAKFGIDSRPRE